MTSKRKAKHEPEVQKAGDAAKRVIAKMGRPRVWDEEKAKQAQEVICERLVSGESLRAICADEDMPSVTQVCRWLRNDPEFCNQYALAREAQAELFADNIIDIADGRLPPEYDILEQKLVEEKQKTLGEEQGEALVAVVQDPVARDRLRIDARKWIASKLLPKKYGERHTADVNVSGPAFADDALIQDILSDIRAIRAKNVTPMIEGKAEDKG